MNTTIKFRTRRLLNMLEIWKVWQNREFCLFVSETDDHEKWPSRKYNSDRVRIVIQISRWIIRGKLIRMTFGWGKPAGGQCTKCCSSRCAFFFFTIPWVSFQCFNDTRYKDLKFLGLLPLELFYGLYLLASLSISFPC